MYKKGDIVAIAFSYILDGFVEECMVEKESHSFNHGELVYGVISVGNKRGQ